VLASETVGFQIVPTGQTLNTTYDFDSVMHYAATAGSANGQPTIVVNPPNQGQQSAIGQRTHLSAGDQQALRLTYGSAVPPTITNISPSATTVWQPAPVVLTGQLMDEVFRVWFGSTQITNFTRPAPDQIQFSVPTNATITTYQITVESHTGVSAPVNLQITGNDPPVLFVPNILVRGLSMPVIVHSDNIRRNLLLASFDNRPSVVPGVINLGIGNQFTALADLGTQVGGANGISTFMVNVPTLVPANTPVWFQSILFDPANLQPPLTTSAVGQTHTF
jgi:Astacin (Peptidase family M12A)/IPT/TIG domain